MTLSAPQLLSDHHDLDAFFCSEPALDDWLKKRARKNQISGASRTYVVCDENRVTGYYSLASGAIALIDATTRMRRNMPDPVPMVILGRLAVASDSQGHGLGSALLADAIRRTLQAADILGIRGIMVHAISSAARQFYLKNGFEASPGNSMTLILGLADVSAHWTIN